MKYGEPIANPNFPSKITIPIKTEGAKQGLYDEEFWDETEE